MRHQLPKVIHLQSSSGCDEWSMQPGIAQNYLRESNYLVRRCKRQTVLLELSSSKRAMW